MLFLLLFPLLLLLRAVELSSSSCLPSIGDLACIVGNKCLPKGELKKKDQDIYLSKKSQLKLCEVPRYFVHFSCFVSGNSISYISLPNGDPQPKHAGRPVEDPVPLSAVSPTATTRHWEVLEKGTFFNPVTSGTCKFRLQIRATLTNFNLADQEWG